ncbi:MAG TPA: polysaccharide deacetylase family protein [Burkholderiales bacterium]|nr:polysaccharide deacetylase family protein [Burkholderiales bacterium]
MKLEWPNGKRVAVLVSVLLETWAEGRSPTYFPRTTPLKAGTPDLPGHQWSQYGGAEGVWRIVSILDRAGVRGTVFANALSAEKHPELIRAIVKSGHGLQAHGYAQNEYLLDMSDEEQQKTIRRCLDVLERASGTRPQGWVTPVYGSNAITHELLVREGLKWHGDALDTSLPQVEKTPSGSIVALPWSDFVDNRVLRASPRDYYDAYVETLDYLSENERLGLVNVAIHGHFGGRPLMSAVFARLVAELSKRSDVWIASYGEIAEWFTALGVDRIPAAERFA